MSLPADKLKPKIWVISELFYPEETSTGYILTKIAESLTDDFNVRVICGPPTYSKLTSKVPSTEIHNGVFIERCKLPRLNKNKLLPRAIKALWLSVSVFLRSLSKIKKGDSVLVVTNPASLLLISTIVCGLKKAKLTILVHDVFPENIVAAGLISRDSVIIKVLSGIISIPYLFSKGIVVIGRDMGELIKRKIGDATDKIEVIPNWADVDEVVPVPRATNPIIEKHGLSRNFIVQFAGNLGRVQGIEYLLEAASLIDDKDIHFVFIGSGAKAGSILDHVKSGKKNNISLLEPQPRSMQSVFLGACDIGVVSLSPGMFGLGVPSKTYNIMAAGKPIVAIVEPDSEIGYLVNTARIGWVVNPGDAAGLARTLSEAKSNPDLLREMGARARELAENSFALKNITDAYKQHFKKLCCEGEGTRP